MTLLRAYRKACGCLSQLATGTVGNPDLWHRSRLRDDLHPCQRICSQAPCQFSTGLLDGALCDDTQTWGAAHVTLVLRTAARTLSLPTLYHAVLSLAPGSAYFRLIKFERAEQASCRLPAGPPPPNLCGKQHMLTLTTSRYVPFSLQVHRRLRVVIRSYDAAGGLSNQFYCHVGMIGIALAAGAEVVLSTASHRNSSFAKVYADSPWPNVRL